MQKSLLAESSAKLQLRPYQLQVKKDLYSRIREGHSKILLVAGTGAGKTECATGIVADALSRGRKVAFVVHRDNLVRQTVARFSKYGLAPSAVHPDFPKQYDNPLQVVSIQTLTRRKDALHLLNDLTIYDEAHLTAWMRLSKDLILNDYHKIVIGLTATPWRLSKREEMGDLFSALVLAPLPHELIKQGYLVPPKYWGLEGIDTQDVKTVMGDFSLDDLGLITSDPDCVKTAVDEWQRLAENRKTICFCVNVNHSQMLANEFNKRGIPAAHIDGTMDAKNEREPIYQKLRNGEILVVTSCEALAEGFDVPDIGCALLARPTKSKAKYLQQLGRALRIFPNKKDCIILDQAGNVSRHGFVEDFTEKDFALTTSEEIEKGEPPVKECDSCGALLHISIMECPECGHIFPRREKEKANAKLVELRPNIPNESEFPQDLIEYRQWKREAFKKRIAPGFAIAKYRERYDRWPPKIADLGAVFQGNATFGQMKAFAEYLKKVADKKGWNGSKIAQEWAKEFGDTKGLKGFMVLTMLPNAVNQ